MSGRFLSRTRGEGGSFEKCQKRGWPSTRLFFASDAGVFMSAEPSDSRMGRTSSTSGQLRSVLKMSVGKPALLRTAIVGRDQLGVDPDAVPWIGRGAPVRRALASSGRYIGGFSFTPEEQRTAGLIRDE